jgi:hypothetical protein
MNKLATQFFLKDKGGKKITLQASQLWHNVQDKPIDFVPRWAKEFKA